MNLLSKKKGKYFKEITPEETLVKCIETLCHAGLTTLDPSFLKQIKIFCRTNPSLIDVAYKTTLNQLQKKQSEVRLSAFQLITELFKRSHSFRLLVINDLELIVKLAGGLPEAIVMPPPKKSAIALTQLAMLTIPKWKDEFGKTYKQLVVTFEYLVQAKNVDFESVQRVIDEKERARIEKERRAEEINLQVLKDLNDSYDEKIREFDSAITTLDNCFSLLLPPLDDFFVSTADCEPSGSIIEPMTANCELSKGESLPSNSEPTASPPRSPPSDDFNMRLHGISNTYNLVINFDRTKKHNIERTEENSAVIDNLKDILKLAKKQILPMICKWEMSIGNINLKPDHEFVQKVTELKTRLENCLKKCKELRIDGGAEDSSDDDDMEEVVKEGYEPAVLPVICDPHPFYCSSIATPGPSGSLRNRVVEGNRSFENKSMASTPSMSKNKTESISTKVQTVAKPSTRDIQEYLETGGAQSKIDTSSFLSVRMGKWGSGDMEVDEVSLPESLQTKVVDFVRELEPITRSCRAPMPSGGLCPRMDRFKCPFHGRIVDRDENGKCRNPEDELKPSPSKEEPVPDWQEPALLAHLKSVTGIDLKMPEKKGKKKVKKRNGLPRAAVAEQIKQSNLPGVVDVERLRNTPRARLKKKLFNKATLRRIAAATASK